MQKFNKFFLILIFLLGFLKIEAQQTKLLTAEKHNEYGIVYTLPSTSFQIDVVAVKETKIAGPFSKYSKIFTTDTEVISQNEVSWEIESVNITPYGVPDSENRYILQLKAGATTFLSVADDNMLLSINKEVETPVVVSNNSDEVIGEIFNGKEYLEFVNEDFIAAQSSYKQAQILAEELMEIRDAKISLTRGTAETMPTDGKQLEIMLSSLQKQEKALTNAFTGSSWKERIKRSFYFTPTVEGKFVVCAVNSSEGIVDAKKKNASPLYINIKMTEEAALPVDGKGEEKKIPKDAVMYCVPGYGEVSITLDGKSLFQKEFPMSQFGMLFGIAPSVFTDKKEPSYAVFDPTTGALVELGVIK